MTRLITAVFVVLSLLPATPAHAQAVSCANYDAAVWAQSVYDSDPERYAALDSDGDGIACPELGPGAAPALWTDEIPAGAAW